MNRAEALELIRQYAHEIDSSSESYFVLIEASGMPDRFPSDGSENKAMRWLGYMQGALVATGFFTLDDVKRHSRTRKVS